MALLTRAHYVALLTKLAAEENQSSVPEIDNQDISHGELRANLTDARQQLGDLFTNFAAAQKGSTAEIKKLFPKYEKDEFASPLLKLADWHYVQAMQESFLNELEKIGMSAQRPDIRMARTPVMTGDDLARFRETSGTGGSVGAVPAEVGYPTAAPAPAPKPHPEALSATKARLAAEHPGAGAAGAVPESIRARYGTGTAVRQGAEHAAEGGVVGRVLGGVKRLGGKFKGLLQTPAVQRLETATARAL
jgi:hypothetical protein